MLGRTLTLFRLSPSQTVGFRESVRIGLPHRSAAVTTQSALSSKRSGTMALNGFGFHGAPDLSGSGVDPDRPHPGVIQAPSGMHRQGKTPFSYEIRISVNLYGGASPSSTWVSQPFACGTPAHEHNLPPPGSSPKPLRLTRGFAQKVVRKRSAAHLMWLTRRGLDCFVRDSCRRVLSLRPAEKTLDSEGPSGADP